MHAFPLHQSIFWCFSSFLEFYSCFTHHACLFHLLASSLTWFFFSLTTQQFIYIYIYICMYVYIYIYVCMYNHASLIVYRKI
jgi:hypothetical protein